MTDVPQDRQSNTLESEFIARLLDEYKILQDKIDKIGAFRFTIKGWSITVLVAVVFAGSATNVKPLWALAVCAIAVLVGLFLYEWQQTILRYCFGQRCVLIEEQITHLLRAAVKRNGSESLASIIVSLQYIPGIGRHVAKLTKVRRRLSRRERFWRRLTAADAPFYFGLIVLIALFSFLARNNDPRDKPDTKSVTIEQNNVAIVSNASQAGPHPHPRRGKSHLPSTNCDEETAKKAKELKGN